MISVNLSEISHLDKLALTMSFSSQYPAPFAYFSASSHDHPNLETMTEGTRNVINNEMSKLSACISIFAEAYATIKKTGSEVYEDDRRVILRRFLRALSSLSALEGLQISQPKFPTLLQAHELKSMSADCGEAEVDTLASELAGGRVGGAQDPRYMAIAGLALSLDDIMSGLPLLDTPASLWRDTCEYEMTRAGMHLAELAMGNEDVRLAEVNNLTGSEDVDEDRRKLKATGGRSKSSRRLESDATRSLGDLSATAKRRKHRLRDAGVVDVEMGES